MGWVPPVEGREQLVLYAQKLDDALPEDHSVRQLAAIMDQVDWKPWEGEYTSTGPGRSAFHPKVVASALLYGLLKRIRSSRQLEEALQIRIDFRWLVEGRSIDHSTLCKFRTRHHEQLRNLFVQLGVLAQSEGILKLSDLAFDGTKIRANNRKSAKLKTANLRELRDELQRRYDEHAAEAEKLDSERSSEDGEDGPGGGSLPDNLATRLREAERALEEVERLENAGESVPKRLPTTDVECRITPSKDGGFSPNYTPGAMVDVESGLIVATEVIGDTNEKKMLPDALDAVHENFEAVPERVLADGIFNHGSNLVELQQRGIELYSPIASTPENPALRDDPTQPVPEDQICRLPRKKTHGEYQFDKSAFVYDAEQDICYCPAGKPLKYHSTSSHTSAGGETVENRRYKAAPEDCGACSLHSLCIAGRKSKSRQVQRDQYEPLRQKLRRRMETPEAQAIYARRMSVGELPFAVIKQAMGARQFLTRGLARVKQEWIWLATAYNLKRLMPLLARPGPT